MDKSYQITKKMYDYLLPVYGNCGIVTPGRLLYRVDRKIDKYYFIGNHEEYLEMLERCLYL